jgi:FkbM family methyltransferase
MNFISYAQNFEDVMLWRALKHVDRGFYIDVGANHPSIDSVTKVFYDKGWCGINIEPLPLHHAELLCDRPRDVNLQIAAGDKHGEIELWEYDVRGWATASLNVVEQHRKNGHIGSCHKVNVLTLAEICSQHVFGEIHFLKIDVEGFENLVLLGADFSRYRPWIVLVEATRPNTKDEVYCEWEPLLTDVGYKFCYFDGLNRFYISKEHSELLQYFYYPPCVFDNFIRSEQLYLEIRVQQAEDKVGQVEETLRKIYESPSWRWTQPLRDYAASLRSVQSKILLLKRRVKSRFGWIWEGSIAWLTFSPSSRPRRVLKKVFLKAKECIVSRPRLKFWLLNILDRFPALKARLKRIGLSEPSFRSSWTYVKGPEHLSPRAKQIYADFKAAIERQSKEDA